MTKKDEPALLPAPEPKPAVVVELRVDVKDVTRLIDEIGALPTVSVQGRAYVDQAALAALLEQRFQTVKR